MGTLIWFRKVTRTEGQHETAMGHHCVGHGPPHCPLGLVLHQRQSCSTARTVMQLRNLPVTTVGSATAWGDSGHGQAGRGHGAWRSWGPGQAVQAGVASAPGLGGGPMTGREQHERGQQCCHHRGDRAWGMPPSPVPQHRPERRSPALPASVSPRAPSSRRGGEQFPSRPGSEQGRIY